MAEPPEDPEQRKADMLSCPRWILTSLQRERNSRRELEQRLGEAKEVEELRLQNELLQRKLELRGNALMENEATINQLRQSKSSDNEAIKLLMKTKEDEYQASEQARGELEEKLRLLQENMESKAREQEKTMTALSKERDEWQHKLRSLEQQCESDLEEKEHSTRMQSKHEREKKALNEKLQEATARCDSLSEELQNCEKKLQQRTEEVAKLNEWIKSAQERKTKSDDSIRKLMEQKNSIIAEKTEQLSLLKNQLSRSRERAITEKKQRIQSMAISKDTPGLPFQTMDSGRSNSVKAVRRATSRRVSTDRVDDSVPTLPSLTWEMYPKEQEDDPSTFQGSRANSKVELPLVSVRQQTPIPENLRDELIGTMYVEPLLVEPSLSVFKVLCTNAEEDSEVLSTAIVELFQRSSPELTLEALYFTTTKEVARTEDVNTLFRGNSLASKSLSKYSRLVGLPYLHDTLKPLINSLDANMRFELNPDRFEEGDDAERNQETLLAASQLFFDSIVNSVGTMPVQFRLIAIFLEKVVREHFPERPYFGVVNFIFLRFFCVAIATPFTFGLSDPRLSLPNVKRGLLMISKVLQVLANGATFKETFMVPLNDWLETINPRLNEFFEAVTKPLSSSDVSTFAPGRNYTKSKEECSVIIHDLMKGRQDILSAIPEELKVEVDGVVRLRENRFLKGITDKLVPAYHRGKFLGEDPLVRLFGEQLSQSAVMASFSEKGAEIIPYQEREEFADALVHIFGWIHPRRVYSLVHYWIDIEVDNRGSVRPDSVTCFLVKQFVRVVCPEVVSILLQELVDRVIIHNVHVEIDPDRMTDAQLRNQSEGAITLARLCGEWQSDIVAALPKLPRRIWRVFSFLGLQKQQVIAKTLLWAVLCPAIENPEHFGIVKTPPSAKARRTLALISEVFMKKADENLFYETGDSFSHINSFIINETRPFFQEIQNWGSTRPPREESLDEFEVAPESLQKSFILVYRFVTENMPLLSGYMSSATVDWCMKYNIGQVATTKLNQASNSP